MAYNQLTKEEELVIESRQTEPPFSGEYDNFFQEGIFICRRCNAPLFSSKSKFEAHCGWPAFDESYPNAIKRSVDSTYGMKRIEIQCANCHAHLGHEFLDEGFTKTNTRECVNSLSIKFIKSGDQIPTILTKD